MCAGKGIREGEQRKVDDCAQILRVLGVVLDEGENSPCTGRQGEAKHNGREDDGE